MWAVLLAFALTILGMGALTIVGSPSAHAATEGVVTVVVDTESEAEAIYHNTESKRYTPTANGDYHVWQWSTDKSQGKIVDLASAGNNLRKVDLTPFEGDTRVNMLVFIGNANSEKKPDVSKNPHNGVLLQTADLIDIFRSREVKVDFWRHMAHGDKEKNKPEVKQDKDLYRVTYTQEILPIGGAVSVPAPTDSNKHLGETANPFPKNTKFALADAGFSSGLKIESTGAITGILDPSYSEGRKALYVDVTFPDGSTQKASAEYVATKPLTVELDTASFKDVQGPFHVSAKYFRHRNAEERADGRGREWYLARYFGAAR